MKKLQLTTTTLLTIFMAIFCFNISAFAATAPGQESTVNVGSYQYGYYSSAHSDDSTYVWASGTVNTKSSNSAPTGYIAINAGLYNSSGTLKQSSGWIYNSSPTRFMHIATDTYYGKGKGLFYAQSKMRFYNNGNYVEYTSLKSPYIQMSSMFSDTQQFSTLPKPEKYKVNENGLTYGSDFYATSTEDSPDLIRAIGVNGVEGYIYSKDINLKLNTLDEVLDYINSGQSNYSVPVYAEDGITIVDTFEITIGDYLIK